MKLKRTSVASSSTAPAVPVRVVLVTMDSHFAGAAARAQEELRKDIPGLEFSVHAADEFMVDGQAMARCHEAIATGDIVIAAMLFLEDHIRAVLPALQARRDHCDAMLGAVSPGDIVKLTRLGKLDMSKEATGVMALMKRLRGAGKDKSSPAASGRGQMKMLKQLPKLLRFMPGTAQDLRAYFLSLQYWLAGSEENLTSMVRLLIGRYASGPRAAFAGISAAPPVEYPDVGLYHPRIKPRITERLADLPARGEAGTVGVLLLRSYVLSANAGHYDGVITALEARGLRVIPAFASGLDSRPAIEAYFIRDGEVCVDAVLSLTGFSLVGGPAYNDARAAETILARLDVPYLAAHPAEFQTLEHWEADPRGLTPVEATMMVAIPELDGAIGPITFGGRSDAAGGEARRDMAAHGERAAMLAARVTRLVALRRTPRAERRTAIVLFNFPPNAGNAGTAAYLGVFESLFNTLGAMKAAGYTVDVPADVDALRTTIIEGNAQRFGTIANVAHRISADDHVRREPHLGEIEAVWGTAPGRALSDGSGIFVLGAKFGNVFVGLQPGFGWEGDPMRLLFEHDFAPTHAFSAFYRWLREDFAAHAVLHFGTHGALEFMPGKQVGLSAQCWPDRLIGDMPNFYLYAANNPSEGAIAKRRAAATLISYLSPPVTNSGLYRGLADLKSSLDRWRNMEPGASGEAVVSLAELLQAQATAVDLTAAEPAWGDGAQAQVEQLTVALLELEYTLIPQGLHVVGVVPSAEQRANMLDAAGIPPGEERDRLYRLLSEDHELPAIIHALDAGYVRPAPGGDLLRTTEILPTGRNVHGFDPFRIPSAFAVKDGARQADRLLARHLEESGELPETVGLVLWGTDNLKTEGGPIAQALWLMGAEPRHDAYGRVVGAKLIPLELLGRQRVDTIITLSGIFRDLLPMQTKLLAEAALLAAEADEPIAQNFIRAHALAYLAEHGGDIAQAALRVFGNDDGAYGANVNALLDAGTWDDEDELGDAYLKRKGFAYSAGGAPARADKVLGHMLATVSVTYQNLDSVDLGVTTIDHYYDTLGGLSRAVNRARGGKAAAIYISDQTRGEGTVRSLSEQVALETRTRTLNPAWYEALLAHGYEGVREIESQVTNTMGWSATTGQVDPWVYREMAQTYILDPEMRARLAQLNPAASAKIVNRLIEAHDRSYWTPDPEMLDALRQASDELEDRMEGINITAVAA